MQMPCALTQWDHLSPNVIGLYLCPNAIGQKAPEFKLFSVFVSARSSVGVRLPHFGKHFANHSTINLRLSEKCREQPILFYFLQEGRVHIFPFAILLPF